jgi:hypothetical protein
MWGMLRGERDASGVFRMLHSPQIQTVIHYFLEINIFF